VFKPRRRRSEPDPLLVARIEARRAVAAVAAQINDTVGKLGMFSSDLVALSEQLSRLQALAEDSMEEGGDQ
jgi:hypothetical protein